MADNGQGILWNRDATDEEICEAMGHAIARALVEHKRLGNPVVTWDRESDRVLIVQPEDILISDEATAGLASTRRT